MTRKTLTLKTKRPPQPKPTNAVEDPTSNDPITRFFNGTAIHPSPRLYLANGVREHRVRAMDLITPISMGQRGLIVAERQLVTAEAAESDPSPAPAAPEDPA